MHAAADMDMIFAHSDVAGHSPRCFFRLNPCMLHRYFIKHGKKQATLKGKEHREAVHYLAFAAAGLFGRTGAGGRDHRVLTWILCELAAILKSAFDVRPKTWAQAKSVCRRMSRWIENDFQTLFGPSQTTKLHRAVSHLLDEFILRGNLQDGNTGVKEALHKFVKQAFSLTNKSRDKAALQMVLTEKIESLVRRSRQVSKTPAKKAATVRCVRARGAVSSFSEFAATSGLVALDVALHCSTSDHITTQSGALLPGVGDHQARGERTVLWATQDLSGGPWYGWVRYRADEGTVRVGQALAVVAAHNGTLMRTVVLHRAEYASTVLDCPSTAYGCKRLQWCSKAREGKVHPDLEASTLHQVIEVMCVDHDWEEWVDRVGVCRFLKSFASDASDWREYRFFINKFV